MDGIIRLLFDISFDILGFHISISDFVTTIYDLCDWTKIQTTDIWAIGRLVHVLIVPIGLSMLTLFMMMEFIKKAMDVERLSWEQVVMLAIKFFIIKYLLQNSFTLMLTIMNICQNSFSAILPVVTSTTSIDVVESLVELIDGGLVEEILMSIFIVILYIPFLGTMVGILVQVFLRIGKLILCFCFAPIPIALGVSDEGQNACKSFFLYVVGLGIEAIIIIICAKIYAVSLGSIADANSLSKMIAIMFANGLFMALVSFGSQLAEKLTGGH